MRGDIFQKIPVVGDDQAGVDRADGILEPQNAFQIQVIGWLVQKQHVGRSHQGSRDGEPLPPSAGEPRRRRIGGLEAGPPEYHVLASRLLLVLERQTGQRRGEDGADGFVRPEERVLRNISQTRLLSQGPHPRVWRLPPGENLEQRSLAAAIRPDQAGAVALGKGQGKIFKKDARAKRLAQSGATQQNGHLFPAWHGLAHRCPVAVTCVPANPTWRMLNVDC